MVPLVSDACATAKTERIAMNDAATIEDSDARMVIDYLDFGVEVEGTGVAETEDPEVEGVEEA